MPTDTKPKYTFRSTKTERFSGVLENKSNIPKFLLKDSYELFLEFLANNRDNLNRFLRENNYKYVGPLWDEDE